MHALFVTYGLRDATPAEHAELCEQLAPAVAAVPGLVSKTWLTNGDTGRHGGFYLFATRADFERFVASELFDALRTHGSIRDVVEHEFAVAMSTTAGASRPSVHHSRRSHQ